MDIAATVASSGLQQAGGRVSAIAGKIAASGDAGDRIDLSSQAVALIQARDVFAANISTLKTIDEIQKSLFDLLG